MTNQITVLGDDKSLVYFKNPVAVAKYKLTTLQQKVFIEIALLAKRSPQSDVYQLYMRDFLRKIGTNTNELVAIKMQIAQMAHIPIIIEKTKTGSIVDAAIFASVERFENDPREYVEIEISKKVKPYFIEFAEGEYFKYEIKNTRKLKSVYAIRLYLFLKSWRRVGKISVGYDELRTVAGVGESEYKLFGDFHKRVIKSAYDELRDKTDLSFEYTLERERKKHPNSPVVKINFRIQDNGSEEVVEDSQLSIPLTTQVDAHLLQLAHQIEKISESDISGIVALYSRDRVLDVLLVASDEQAKGNRIRSLIPYLHNALKNKSGIGKSRLQSQKQQQAQIVKIHKEIELAIKRGLDNFKLVYLMDLGSNGTQDDKDRYFAKLQQEISQNPRLNKVYKNGDEWNLDILRSSLGAELNSKSDEELAILYMESIQTPIQKIQGFWIYLK